MTGQLLDVVLAGPPRRLPRAESFVVVPAGSAADLAAYRRLRHDTFVVEQGLFDHTDLDLVDDDPRTRVLVARTPDGTVLGGVRLHPMTGTDLGWWRGSRLTVARDARRLHGVGVALVRAACATAEAAGALRFDAVVQARNEALFRRLGWTTRARAGVHGTPHVEMDWPVGRIQRLADATKAALGSLVGDLLADRPFRGDDGAPVPGTDVIAACDAILPAMVERDPEWAGWCAVLVNVNDLSAMGAGGHTQLGVPAALSVTALGRTSSPVPGGGGRPGHRLRVTADLGGGWRPGYTGTQWDSSSHRTHQQLRALGTVVPALAPTAAKDVSMSGLVGTTGMLAEASGCRAVLDVAAVPAPQEAVRADWLTCFPGFAMVTAETAPSGTPLPDFVRTAVCGELTDGSGVGLRWPDGAVTDAIATTVTGLGPAGRNVS
jgi:putative N-acetyltransferase (TIGR04045 family)